MLDKSAHWSAPWELKDYQADIVAGMSSVPSWATWIKPGGGKTVVALVQLLRLWMSGRRMVVAVPGGAIDTWREEIRQCTAFDTVVLEGVRGAVRKRSGAWLPNVEVRPVEHPTVYLVGWETLHPGSRGDFYLGWWAWISENLAPFAITFDETHYAKNPSRWTEVVDEDGETDYRLKETRTAATMVLARNASNRLELTATPISNLLIDLFAQLDLLEPMAWGNKHGFGLHYCAGEHDGYGFRYEGRSNTRQLNKRLATLVKTVPASVINAALPPKRRQLIWLSPVELNGASREATQARRAAVRSGDEQSITEAAVCETASRKRSWTVQNAVRDALGGAKVLVFTGRVEDCERLGEEIAKKVSAVSSQVPVWMAHGSTPSQERTRIRHAYMDHRGGCILVGTGYAWGEYLNLQDTDILYVVMLPWTPRHIIQWEGRVSRLGQTRPVLVRYPLIRGSVEEIIHESLLDKLPTVAEVVGDEEAAAIEQALSGTRSQSDMLRRLVETARRAV